MTAPRRGPGRKAATFRPAALAVESMTRPTPQEEAR